MKRLKEVRERLVKAAESLGGRRFNLLVASSLIVTATILVSAAIGAGGGNGALAALLGGAPSSQQTPATSSPAAGSPVPSAGAISPKAGGPPTVAGGPLVPASPNGAPAASGPESEPRSDAPPVASVPEPSGPVGPIEHVVVVSLASPGYEESLGGASRMPYLSATLRPKGELVPDYTLLTETGLANAIATISGQRPNPLTEAGCTIYATFPPRATPDKRGLVPGAGCIYPVEALTVADQISSARLRWRAYVEDMADESGPHNCVQPQPDEPDEPPPGGYAARQNPFVYFHSLLDVGDCAINDVPLEQLEKDLRKPETTPELAYVAPNLCHAGLADQCPAGEAGGAAAADAFLAEWAPKILAAKAIRRAGMLAVVFNAVASPGTAGDPPRTGALLVSRYVTPNGTREGEFTPYSLLRTIEELFGLEPLGEAASRKTVSLGKDLLGPEF